MGRGMNVGKWTLATVKEHPQNVLFSQPRYIPPHSHHIHPTQPQLLFPPPPSPQEFSVWGHPLTFLFGEKTPSQGRSFKVLRPKDKEEEMT